MNTKVVIGSAVVLALLLLAWILSLGSAPGTAEPASPPVAERPAGEPGAPHLADLEREREADRAGESRVAAEAAAPELTILHPGRPGSPGGPAPAGAIRGRVLDADGRPVAGAGIFVGPFVTVQGRGIRPQTSGILPPGRGGEANGETDLPRRIGESADEGRFEVARVPDGTVFHARSEQLVPVVAVHWWGQDPAYVEPILVVARAAAVAGIVVDEEGAPLAGTRIALRLPENFRASLGVILDRAEPLEYHVVSGADGRFEIFDAPGVVGRHLVVEREGSPLHFQSIDEGPETQVRIVLHVAPEPEIAARGVVLDADGKPVPEASVRLAGRVATTGEDGKFVLDASNLQPGAEIVAAKPGFLPGRVPFEGPGESVTVRLGPPARVLAGRVVDAAGKPKRSVEVRALGLTRVAGGSLEDLATWGGEGPFTVADTDTEGKFRIGGLEARAYVVGLVDRSSLRTMRTEPIQAGREDLEIVFKVEIGTVRIAGRVVDRGGTPVAHAEVRLVREIVREEGGFKEGVDVVRTADAEGLFDFGEVAADVRAVHAGFPGEMAYEHPFESGEDLSSLVLLAFRRAHFQIDLTGSNVQADGFALLDVEGRPMPIASYEGNIAKSAMRWAIHDQRSDTLTALDAADTLVLYRKREEVGRHPVRFVPGDVTIVRP